jgi:hypothetical protein
VTPEAIEAVWKPAPVDEVDEVLAPDEVWEAEVVGRVVAAPVPVVRVVEAPPVGPVPVPVPVAVSVPVSAPAMNRQASVNAGPSGSETDNTHSKSVVGMR